jgi:hypothetical protein
MSSKVTTPDDVDALSSTQDDKKRRGRGKNKPQAAKRQIEDREMRAYSFLFAYLSTRVGIGQKEIESKLNKKSITKLLRGEDAVDKNLAWPVLSKYIQEYAEGIRWDMGFLLPALSRMEKIDDIRSKFYEKYRENDTLELDRLFLKALQIPAESLQDSRVRPSEGLWRVIRVATDGGDPTANREPSDVGQAGTAPSWDREKIRWNVSLLNIKPKTHSAAYEDGNKKSYWEINRTLVPHFSLRAIQRRSAHPKDDQLQIYKGRVMLAGGNLHLIGSVDGIHIQNLIMTVLSFPRPIDKKVKGVSILTNAYGTTVSTPVIALRIPCPHEFEENIEEDHKKARWYREKIESESALELKKRKIGQLSVSEMIERFSGDHSEELLNSSLEELVKSLRDGSYGGYFHV